MLRVGEAWLARPDMADKDQSQIGDPNKKQAVLGGGFRLIDFVRAAAAPNSLKWVPCRRLTGCHQNCHNCVLALFGLRTCGVTAMLPPLPGREVPWTALLADAEAHERERERIHNEVEDVKRRSVETLAEAYELLRDVNKILARR